MIVSLLIKVEGGGRQMPSLKAFEIPPFSLLQLHAVV